MKAYITLMIQFFLMALIVAEDTTVQGLYDRIESNKSILEKEPNSFDPLYDIGMCYLNLAYIFEQDTSTKRLPIWKRPMMLTGFRKYGPGWAPPIPL